MYKRLLSDWWPAVLMMACIYVLSSRPASALPNLGWADMLVKKGGHVLGYAALALGYWRAMTWKSRRWWLAWLLATAYGVTDELHQMLVQGRHASPWDVILFDAPGAAFGLWVAWRISRTRPQPEAEAETRNQQRNLGRTARPGGARLLKLELDILVLAPVFELIDLNIAE